ncbi:MAG: nucleotide exchange factor GrpE [Hormoscilla sp. SP5CHS1]|nr:nucleotide exchange factor GrpE [Hormoscilla sp. SP12CHS1]MBC6454654.1 nucleotide exchange factor GrpE [Hormoscilla sp. SP5CHS1]
MVHSPNLFGFGWLLLLASVLLIAKISGADTDAEERVELPHDSLLRDRLNELGIANWKELRKKTGLSTPRLLEARRGSLEKLTFSEVNRLASTLNWTPVELRSSLGFASTDDEQVKSLSTAISQLQHLSDRKTTEVSELQQEREQLQQKLQQMESEKTAAISQLQQEGQGLRSQLQQLETEKQATLAEFQQEREQLRSQCSQLEQLDSEKTAAISQLQQLDSEKTGEISGLQQEREQLRSQLEQLDSEKTAAILQLQQLDSEKTGEISGLQQEREQLRQQLEQLDSEKTGEISGLQQEREQLRQQLEQMESEKTAEITELQQAWEQLRWQLQQQTAEMIEFQQQCQRLQSQLQQQPSQLNADFRDSTFAELQALLTKYPSARQIAETKPDLPAKNMMKLFTPLENMLENWGYEPIASVWEQVRYNRNLHEADTDDIQEGEMVYVRFVGYKSGDRVVCPAKVSRTLPAGIKPKNS